MAEDRKPTPRRPGVPRLEVRARQVVVLDAPVIRTFQLIGPTRYRPFRVDSWDELAAMLESTAPSTLAVVDPYSGVRPGEGPSHRLRELIRYRPSVTFVAALDLENTPVPHVLQLLEWGVAEMVDLELENTPGALLPRLRGTHARPLKKRMMDAILSPYATSYAAVILNAACEVAADGGGAPELAAHFDVEPRTISGWCRRHALPAPRRLQAWLRVLVAAALLEEEDRPVLNVARCTGYANDQALRRAMRELVGGEPATMDHRAIFPTAAERFNWETRELREQVRERRKAARAARERL